MQYEMFDGNRLYDDADEELDIIAPRSKRAQWRHRWVGPPFLKFGRRVKYHGADLNAYVEDNRVSPGDMA